MIRMLYQLSETLQLFIKCKSFAAIIFIQSTKTTCWADGLAGEDLAGEAGEDLHTCCELDTTILRQATGKIVRFNVFGCPTNRPSTKSPSCGVLLTC